MQPISYRIEEVEKVTGWSRTKTYQELQSGALPSFKDGKRRYVLDSDLRTLIESRAKAGRLLGTSLKGQA